MDIRNDFEIQNYIIKIKEKINEYNQKGKVLYSFVITFGCQQNEADSEKIRGLLDLMGYTRAESPENADIIIVNTCAVREHAEMRALSTIGELKHIKEKNCDAIIGVCGCMAARGERAEQLKHRYPQVDFSLEPNSIYKIPSLIYSKMFAKTYKRTFLYSCDNGDVCEGLPISRENNSRAWVSVMYGCNNFCSYCIVPYTRGRERSRQSGDIISEVKCLVDKGYKEITLLGQNVNSYKSDINFTELLKKIDEIDGDFRIRFMTSHPKDVPDSLIELMGKRDSKIENHFHLPLQSGSDRILKLMNRHYDKKKYIDTVEKLRKANPDISLTTDIIVGFPGETEEDFNETLEIIKKVRFDMVYSFIYSPREGTPAAKYEQLPEKVKSERFTRMLKLLDDISLENNNKLVGNTVRVLVESKSEQNESMYSGRTKSAKLVHFPASDGQIGKFMNVKIERAGAYALYALPVNEDEK